MREASKQYVGGGLCAAIQESKGGVWEINRADVGEERGNNLVKALGRRATSI